MNPVPFSRTIAKAVILLAKRSLSIGVNRSYTPPILRINGVPTSWQSVKYLPKSERNQIRLKLSGMPDGKKMVAWTMPGAVVPSVK